MLDASSALAMSTPRSVSDDPVASKDRRDELRDTSIAAISQNTAMATAHRLDVGAAVVKRVVAVTRPAAVDADDAEILSTHEHLRVARPAVVLRLAAAAWSRVGTSVPSTIHVKRRSAVTVRGSSSARRGTRSVTTRCACEREIANTAASSRYVRFVRRAVQTITRRRQSDCAHGRPRGPLRDPRARCRAIAVRCDPVRAETATSS